jgi:CRISPR-associated protein Cmr5
MENTQTSLRQYIEQERGREAWQDVLNIKQDAAAPATLQKEYRSLARGLNAMIQINGLGQTLGFLKAKGKNDTNKAHFRLLRDLSNWMAGEDQEHRPHFTAANKEILSGDDGFLKWVTHARTTSADYRRATTECLAFGVWLRRFAEAELEGDES